LPRTRSRRTPLLLRRVRAALAPAIANAGPTPDFAAHDAKSYRERGIFAYREGDLYRAIADFDRMIQHNPSFADAYIDRGIVFYRMREFDRAFADIAQAKCIENSNRNKPSLPAPHKASPSSR
jgi:tetratricopeptide (TPR) repeat protein